MNNDLPGVILGYKPGEAERVRFAADALCSFDPDAAAYRLRTEAWVMVVLRADDSRREAEEA